MKKFFTTKISQAVPLMAVFDLPCQGQNVAIADCVSQIYTVSLSLVGIVAFVQIVYGGFLLLTAAGNTSKIGQAMSKITNAIFGIVLLFSSYLILRTINPDLVQFNFNLEKITKEEKLAEPPDGSGESPEESRLFKPKEELNESGGATKIESFEVTPTLASVKDNTRLDFKLKVYGKTASLEVLCPGDNVKIKPEIILSSAGTDTRIKDALWPKGIFGDGKIVSFFVLQQPITEGEETVRIGPVIRFVEYYGALSCSSDDGERLIVRSGPVRVNLVTQD